MHKIQSISVVKDTHPTKITVYICVYDYSYLYIQILMGRNINIYSSFVSSKLSYLEYIQKNDFIIKS
jgi:hypothetical protein